MKGFGKNVSEENRKERMAELKSHSVRYGRFAAVVDKIYDEVKGRDDVSYLYSEYRRIARHEVADNLKKGRRATVWSFMSP
jgi:hypothetical protein